jgi:electron transfer flavoprotein alpha subunit
MGEIFTLIEHRQDEIRDITFELLTCGRKLAEQQNSRLTAVLLGHSTSGMVDVLKSHAHRLIVVDHELCKTFNAETYQAILVDIIQKEKPLLTLIGHTAFGWDLAPALATQLGVPFTTDCLAVEIQNGAIHTTRQMYDGKLNAHVTLRQNESYMVTVRSGSVPAEDGSLSAEVENYETPLSAEPAYRKFLEYIEAAVGEVDITKADIVVSIGRGVKEQANMPAIEEFVKAIGGVLACSRPVVDAGWLPKDRQVGSSGKTVKPKLYIALGISGAFQHIVGMKGADTIIAVNKDPNAPIFNEADYGIVEDLFKVVPAFKEKIVELKK